MDVNNFKRVIEDIVDVKINQRGITKYISAKVQSVNADGSLVHSFIKLQFLKAPSPKYLIFLDLAKLSFLNLTFSNALLPIISKLDGRVNSFHSELLAQL